MCDFSHKVSGGLGTSVSTYINGCFESTRMANSSVVYPSVNGKTKRGYVKLFVHAKHTYILVADSPFERIWVERKGYSDRNPDSGATKYRIVQRGQFDTFEAQFTFSYQWQIKHPHPSQFKGTRLCGEIEKRRLTVVFSKNIEAVVSRFLVVECHVKIK